jgi:branched-subunit amino acid aminotransferase/4-amino-4-deoxychorismate lyase
VVEEKFRPEALFDAAEAFITGTTAGVWPIASVDDHPLPAAPGPVSTALRERFERVVSGRDPAFERWLTYVGEAGA